MRFRFVSSDPTCLNRARPNMDGAVADGRRCVKLQVHQRGIAEDEFAECGRRNVGQGVAVQVQAPHLTTIT